MITGRLTFRTTIDGEVVHEETLDGSDPLDLELARAYAERDAETFIEAKQAGKNVRMLVIDPDDGRVIIQIVP